jgi:hypothetical protein
MTDTTWNYAVISHTITQFTYKHPVTPSLQQWATDKLTWIELELKLGEYYPDVRQKLLSVDIHVIFVQYHSHSEVELIILV